MRTLACASLVTAFVLAISASACDQGPPVKTARGEIIKNVEYEEVYSRSSETNGRTVSGPQLQKFVELLDKHELVSRTGSHDAKGVLDSGTLTLIVRPYSGGERKITLKNCSDEKVCAFFKDVHAAGLMQKEPMLCTSAKPCDKK